MIIKHSKNINNEKPINPLVVAEKLQHIYQESFDIFNALFESSNSKPIVTGTFTIVCFNYHLQETITVPDSIKNAYHPFEE